LGYTDAELSIVIVDDEEMADLNRRYRQQETTTDVLAFSMSEGEFGDVVPGMLGDVVISAPTADSIGRCNNVSLSTVLDLLVVHGTLHLTGYDHEHNDKRAAEMNAKSVEMMKLLGHLESDLGWFLEPKE
jgi:probable rRNA maturation factor